MPEEYSTINEVGLTFILLMGVLIFVLPRRYAVIPVIATGLYITLGQMIIVATLHISMMRMIILVGLARVLVRGEIKNIKLNVIDYLILAWLVSNFVAYYLLRGTTEAFINRLGYAYNALGSYFLFRCLIRCHEDVFRSIKIISILTIPLALFMIAEYITGRNMFSIFGGVPEMTVIRDGKLRCQGPFIHPILAGTYGATSFSMFVALWVNHETKLFAAAGVIASIIIVTTSGSSGPLLAFIVSVIGLMLWHVRAYLRWFVWGGIATIITLHMVMKASVWSLIGRVSELAGGGTGWHRVELIDATIEHFDEWWLIGTEYTRHWMTTGLTNNPNSADITNMYIRQAVDGGLITMSLFIMLIYYSFRCLGKVLNKIENKDKYAVWCLGSTLLTHATSFISVTYFDQMFIFWCLILALVAAEYMGIIQNAAPVQTVTAKLEFAKTI